uniref:Transmembrane protein 179 n=1 Tax=Angiostrongylus cantonensis TaxID=6313 RepID=A0A158P8A3_ANGCA
MYDEEPRALCNLPLSGTVGIISSLVLLSQVLALFLVCSNNFFIYFFELIVAFGMVFFLSQGVRYRKPGYLTVYLAYLAIYVFMMFFIIFGLLIGLSFLPTYTKYCSAVSSTSTMTSPVILSNPSQRIEDFVDDVPTTSVDVECVEITGAFWANIWSSVTLCFLSIVVSCIQIRYTLLLYKYLRRRQREQSLNLNVSYQHFVPGAPPRYTPDSPYTVQASAPARVEADPLPPKTSHPPVIANLQADSLAPPTLSKNGLSPSFMAEERAPEYTETPGPSESTFRPAISLRTEPSMDEIDLREAVSAQPPIDLLK